MQTFYLNNSGHRWTCGHFIGRKFVREKLPVRAADGSVRNRAVDYWEACGNFAFPTVRVGGKRVVVYPDSDVEPEYWQTFEDKYPEKKKV